MRKLLLELNGKLSALIFGFMTKNTSTFHSSCAIKWPTIQMNISRIFFFFVSGFCCPHQEAGGALRSGVKSVPAPRMSEHVLQ